MSHYTVTAERSGKWWALQCVEVPGALSQVFRLDQAADTIREAIAWVADVPEEEIEIEVQVVLPETVSDHLEVAKVLRSQSAKLQALAAQQTRRAVGELHTQQRMTYRDIGEALGISHQRAAQLATEAKDMPQEPMEIYEFAKVVAEFVTEAAEINIQIQDPHVQLAPKDGTAPALLDS